MESAVDLLFVPTAKVDEKAMACIEVFVTSRVFSEVGEMAG